MPYVFGYGSLVDRQSLPGSPRLAQLNGFRRVWNVAMDNSQDLPGYKYFRRISDGVRPRAFVTFLNLAPDAGSSVNGVLFHADDAQLRLLDARERNYTRCDVTSAVRGGGQEIVWTYIGTAAAEARFNAGPAIVSCEYLKSVEAAFASLGPSELASFRASTAPPTCPVVDLRRVDLPAG